MHARRPDDTSLDGSRHRLEAAIRELADAILADLRAQAVATAAPAPDRLLDVEAAAAELGIGRTMAYGLVGRGELRTVRVGRRRLVPASAIAEYIAGAAR